MAKKTAKPEAPKGASDDKVVKDAAASAAASSPESTDTAATGASVENDAAGAGEGQAAAAAAVSEGAGQAPDAGAADQSNAGAAQGDADAADAVDTAGDETASGDAPAHFSSAGGESHLAGDAASVDEVNTAQAISHAPEAAGEILAGGGVDTSATLASIDDVGDEPGVWQGQYLEYPILARVTNNTRMPVQMTAVPLGLNAAPHSEEVVIPTQGHHESLLADLAALRALNDFAEDAFVVEVLQEDYAE